MCWNISHGRWGNNVANSALPRIAEQIRRKSSDIVLLNEIRVDKKPPFGSGVNQFRALCDMTGLAYYDYGATTTLDNLFDLKGWLCTGILSRYPILSKRMIPVMRDGNPTTYGTCEVTVNIDGLIHHIFATRFDASHPIDREAGIRQTVALIQAIDVRRPVIFGGDFNTGTGQADFDNFFDSGLREAFAERPDPEFGNLDQIDYVFYRGPYQVTQMEQRCFIEIPNPPGERGCTLDAASDHPSVFVELMTPPADFMALYCCMIRLKHLRSVGVLHSHPHNYGHPGSSGQQQVTAYGGADDNDFWLLKGPHGSPNLYRMGQPIIHGDFIRLEHMTTKRNLHSHADIPSPVTGQQEVTCFGENGIGDENDNWQVEVEGGGSWTFGKHVRLIHAPTGHSLHSHAGFSHPQWTMGQQEVTCYSGSDENDWWYLGEVRQVNAAEFVSQSVPSVIAPGATQDVSLVFRNTGTTTWDSSKAYYLGSQAPQDNLKWGRNRSNSLTVAVPPGAEYTFIFPITAPSIPGDVGFQWQMVQEGVTWFGNKSEPVNIPVRLPHEPAICNSLRGEIADIEQQILSLEEGMNGDQRHDAQIRRKIVKLRTKAAVLRQQARENLCAIP